MNVITPLINGASYEWADITLNIMGVPIVGITNIEYKQDQDMMNVYGAGRMPVSRGYGKITPEAKITLLMEEVEAISAAAQNVSALGLIQDIPEFDIVVAYLDSRKTPVVHKLRNCRFKNNNRVTKTGDQSIEVQLDLIISHVEGL
jgi:hypothetical protein